MPQAPTQQLAQQLNKAFNLIQQNQIDDALRLVKQLVRKSPKQPDVLHLAALAYKANGDAQTSEQFFKRCLSIKPASPQILNNLANLLKSLGRFDEAEENYQKAIKLQPNYIDAVRNLALSQLARESYSEALGTLQLALELDPNDVSSLTALGDCHRKMGDHSAAKIAYEKALTLNPKAATALHNLGLTSHLLGELSAARGYYQRAHESLPEHPVMLLSYANSIYESGDSQEATDLLASAVFKQPEAVGLHQRLNELLFEQGEVERFCRSYQTAIQKAPQNVALKIAMGEQLFRAGMITETLASVEAGVQAHPASHELRSLYGQALAEYGELEKAEAQLCQALDQRFSKGTAQQLVKLYLISEKFQQAQALIGPLQKSDPDCQLSWALQGTIWRATDQERYRWLLDYENMIQAYILETPVGFGSLAEFLSALEAELLSLHISQAAPLQQTLRHGTQTAARLLHQPNKLIQSLRLGFEKVVNEYMSSMADVSDNHPLYSRKGSKFDFSGSWSVKLMPNGFHVNHVHPAGWISSSCYISLPPSMQQNANDGAIKFGESPLGLPERDSIERTIQPKPGMVVLFPSYMWHGTVPFRGSESDFRLTAPFDAVPL